jgi:hypothetical protein
MALASTSRRLRAPRNLPNHWPQLRQASRTAQKARRKHSFTPTLTSGPQTFHVLLRRLRIPPSGRWNSGSHCVETAWKAPSTCERCPWYCPSLGVRYTGRIQCLARLFFFQGHELHHVDAAGYVPRVERWPSNGNFVNSTGSWRHFVYKAGRQNCSRSQDVRSIQ